MEDIFDETLDALKSFEENYKGNANVTTTLYDGDNIKKDHKLLVQKLENFSDDLGSRQKHKFRYQVCVYIIFILLSVVGLLGYYVRRAYLPWTAHILLLLFGASVFIIAGIETSNLFLSVEFCASIGNTIVSDFFPNENKGIGTYFSCPSKDTMRGISTAVYQMVQSFNYIYENVGNNSEVLEEYSMVLGTQKRNQTHFNTLLKNLKSSSMDDKYKKEYMKQIGSLMTLNNLMAGLLTMNGCRAAKNIIYYIEENYCYSNQYYIAGNIIAGWVSAFGFILVAIGLNKFITVMRFYFAKSLRGKKQFNEDVIDEDNDDLDDD